MSIVSTDRVQARREFLDHVIHEPDDIFRRMLWIDFQGPNTGCIVDCGVLAMLQLAALFVYESQKPNINL